MSSNSSTPGVPTSNSIINGFESIPVSASIDKSNPFLCSAFGQNTIEFDQPLLKSNGTTNNLNDVMLADNMPLILKPPPSSTPTPSLTGSDVGHASPHPSPSHRATPGSQHRLTPQRASLSSSPIPYSASTLCTPPKASPSMHPLPRPVSATSNGDTATQPPISQLPLFPSPSKSIAESAVNGTAEISQPPKKRKRKSSITQKVIKSDVGNIYRNVSKSSVDQNGGAKTDITSTHSAHSKLPTPNLPTTITSSHVTSSKIPTPTHFGNHMTPVNHPATLLPAPSSAVEDDCGILDLSLAKKSRRDSPSPSSSRNYSSASMSSSSSKSKGADYSSRRRSPPIARPAPPSGQMMTSPANSALPTAPSSGSSRRRGAKTSAPAPQLPPAVAPPLAPPPAAPTPAMSPAFMAAAATAMGHYEQRYAGRLNDVPAVIGMMCTIQALSGYPPPESLEFVTVVRAQMAAVGISEADTATYLEIFAGYCALMQKQFSPQVPEPAPTEPAPKPRRKRVSKNVGTPITSKSQQKLKSHLSARTSSSNDPCPQQPTADSVSTSLTQLSSNQNSSTSSKDDDRVSRDSKEERTSNGVEPCSSGDTDSSIKGQKRADDLLQYPLDIGWTRITYVRNSVADLFYGKEVNYVSPDDVKLKNYQEMDNYLQKNNITNLSSANFSFTIGTELGIFIQKYSDYSERLLTPEEINFICYPLKSNDIKNIVTMQTLSELKVKKKEEKLQEKERLRKMKEMQAIYARDKKKKEQEAKIQEINEKRIQEQKMKDLERERKKNELINYKIQENQRRIEYKEKIKEQKKLQIQKKKEKKIYNTILNEELAKTVDDMSILKASELPSIDKIQSGISSTAFGHCLFIVEFVQTFHDVIGIYFEDEIKLNVLQSGFLCNRDHRDVVLRLLKHFTILVVNEPVHKYLLKDAYTNTGQKLLNVKMTSINCLTEVLRSYFKYMPDRSHKEIYNKLLLDTFMSSSPDIKGEVFECLIHDILATPNVIKKIDEELDIGNALRREKWVIEAKLKKLKQVKLKKQHISSYLVNANDQRSNGTNDNNVELTASAKTESQDADSDVKSEVKDNDDNDCKKENKSDENDSTNGDSKADIDKIVDKSNVKSEIESSIKNEIKSDIKSEIKSEVLSDTISDKVDPAIKSESPAIDVKTECIVGKEESEDNDALTSFLNDDNEMYDKMTEEEIDQAIVNCKQEEEDHVNNVSKSFLRLHARTYGRDRYARRYWCLRYCGGVYVQGSSCCNEVPAPGVDNSYFRGGQTEVNEESQQVPADGEAKCAPEAGVTCTGEEACAVDGSEVVKETDTQENDLNSVEEDNKSQTESVSEPMDISEQIDDVADKDNAVTNTTSTTDCDVTMESPIKDNTIAENEPEEISKSMAESIDELIDTRSSDKNSTNGTSAIESPTLQDSIKDSCIPNTSMSPSNKASISTTTRSSISNITTTTNTATNKTATSTIDSTTIANTTSDKPSSPLSTDVVDDIHVLDLPSERSCDVALHSADDAADFLSGELRLPLWMTSDTRSSATTLATTSMSSISGEMTSQVDPDAVSNEECDSNEIDLEMDLDDDEEDISDEAIEANLTEEIRAKVCALVATEYTTSQPMSIPKDLIDGWWLERDVDKVKALSSAMPARGEREAELQKRIATHLDELTASSARIIDNDMKGCVDIEENCSLNTSFISHHNFNEELTKLENRVCNANLQKKTWYLPKSVRDSDAALDAHTTVKSPEIDQLTISQYKKRILKLEVNIERRYFLEPFARSIELGLKEETDLVTGKMTTAIIVEEASLTKELIQWRKCVSEAKDESQLSLAIEWLSSCIAWDRSIMKVKCEVCVRDDHEEQLLLCDRCENAYHLYCIKPALEEVPANDWFCYECDPRTNNKSHLCFTCGGVGISKATIKCDSCPRYVHLACMLPPALRMPRKWKCNKCDNVPIKSLPNKRPAKRKRKPTRSQARSKNSSCSPAPSVQPPALSAPASAAPVATTSSSSSSSQVAEGGDQHSSDENSIDKDVQADEIPLLAFMSADADDKMWSCGEILNTIFNNQMSIPFRNPVSESRNPEYRKFISKPMDLSTIKFKLKNNTYKSKKPFIKDFRLIFENCKIYNEDTSEIGDAGIKLSLLLEESLRKL